MVYVNQYIFEAKTRSRVEAPTSFWPTKFPETNRELEEMAQEKM